MSTIKKASSINQDISLNTVLYLLQPSPWSLLHVNFGPQHMVERGQEMITDIQGKLLNGLDLNRCK